MDAVTPLLLDAFLIAATAFIVIAAIAVLRMAKAEKTRSSVVEAATESSMVEAEAAEADVQVGEAEAAAVEGEAEASSAEMPGDKVRSLYERSGFYKWFNKHRRGRRRDTR